MRLNVAAQRSDVTVWIPGEFTTSLPRKVIQAKRHLEAKSHFLSFDLRTAVLKIVRYCSGPFWSDHRTVATNQVGVMTLRRQRNRCILFRNLDGTIKLPRYRLWQSRRRGLHGKNVDLRLVV